MSRKVIGILGLGFLVVIACGVLTTLVYQLPPIHDRLSWRLQDLSTQIRYLLNPPERAVFVPDESEDMQSALETLNSKPTATFFDPSTPTTTLPPTLPGPTETPTISPSPIPEPTPIPGAVLLTGVTHEYQQMNNCGPATLSMALSYWGWVGDQRDTRAVLRPNFASIDDKNVSPYEMAAYVEEQTEFSALVRVGGDIDTIKRLVAAGFPVIIEKGFQPPKEDWMGHYELITGYDDSRQRFTTQDSYIMPDFPVPYDDLSARWWRDFNYVYLVIYPLDRETDLLSILGPHADPPKNFEVAIQYAGEEVKTLTGRDIFFAWYNLGTNLLGVTDYIGAAHAYDQAFSVYAGLSEEERPWRTLWYQVGPYEAYFHTGRYQDVINLANQTLSFLGTPILEESLYWRGLSREAIGDLESAIVDLVKAAEINPSSTDVLAQLQRLGVPFP
jgi:tetratricopeptide (TPR) repeat protein